MFSLICVWINSWVNSREAGDLRRHRGHYDVSVMTTGKPLRNLTSHITATSREWVPWFLKTPPPPPPTVCSSHVQFHDKESNKAPHYYPFVKESTGDWRIPSQTAGNEESVFIPWCHHTKWNYMWLSRCHIVFIQWCQNSVIVFVISLDTMHINLFRIVLAVSVWYGIFLCS